jgi:hypothetical protein
MYSWASNKNKLDRAIKMADNFKIGGKKTQLTGTKLEDEVRRCYISLGGRVELQEIKKIKIMEEEKIETPVEAPIEEVTATTDESVVVDESTVASTDDTAI